MKNNYFRIFLFLFFIGLPGLALATHNRAGEITYEQIGDLTIRATITTYTKASSTQADRDSLQIVWGDGTSEIVGRVNGGGQGVILPNADDMKKNIYIAEHTYPGRSTYTISMTDPNRIAGILNVNYPNSVVVPFYIESTFTFLNPQFQGYNNSVVLLQPPIDNGCVGRRFIHNPNAFDPDGDSVAYELTIPLEGRDSTVPRYEYPDMISPGPNNQISMDEVTGDFVWDAPQEPGDYNIAIRIKEYRNGVLINETIRDMQINIKECDNRPPTVHALDELCVIAGDTIRMPVLVTDPDPTPDELVRLSGLGGAFEIDISPAQLIVPPGYQVPPLEGLLVWNTVCDHITDQFTTIVLKGEDNAFDSIGLVDLKSVRLKVTGPPPENLEADSDTRKITLSWDNPYSCQVTETDYFKGFTIWRKTGNKDVPLDTCGVDLSNHGYTEIAFNRMDEDGNKYIYEDEDVEQGLTYCYRVTAEFALISPGGNPYNRVQSLPSNEFCLQLRRDIPLITNVTVDKTDQTDGEIRIIWVNALANDLDTVENPGPYKLILERALGILGTDFLTVAGSEVIEQHFSGLADDTIFIESGLNTFSEAHNYRLAFYTNSNLLKGYATPASSVFLSAVSSDRQNTLLWDVEVPWTNSEVNIYRLNELSGQFEILDVTNSDSYVDRGLINGRSYCYRVETVGSYGISDIKDPLLNLSQEICAIPIDTLPPCSPILEVENLCNSGETPEPGESLTNLLKWTNDVPDCEAPDDAIRYEIYFTRDSTQGFELLDVLIEPDKLEYLHDLGNSLNACYYILAIDSVGNVSEPSNIICTSNCPVYELPNVFTPDGDGINELFHPFPYQFVDRVEFKVFNRWGNLLYETDNPDLNWDGTNLKGSAVAEGTYFYTCDIFSDSPSGMTEKIRLTGYIEVLR